MFINFGRIFFPATLVGYFLKNVKQTSTPLKENLVRRDVFYPGIKYLYKKHCSGYAGIPPGRDGMKNILAALIHSFTHSFIHSLTIFHVEKIKSYK